MVTITEGPELVTEHSWGCFYTCLGHEDRILGLEPSKCALCQDRLSKHQEAAMLLLILFLFWSPPPPQGTPMHPSKPTSYGTSCVLPSQY